MMADVIIDALEKAKEKIGALQKNYQSRELSLVLTRVQAAILWRQEDLKVNASLKTENGKN